MAAGWQWFYQLRTKLILSLFAIFALSFISAMSWIGYYQKLELLSSAAHEASATSETMKSILQLQMLKNKDDILQKTLQQSVVNKQLLHVSIIDKLGTTRYSSDKNEIGKIRKKNDEICRDCHRNNGTVTPSVNTILIQKDKNNYFLRSVNPIANEKECTVCHGTENKFLGILLTEKSVDKTYSLIETVRKRFLFSAIITSLFVIVIISVVTEKFVNKPIKKLISGTREIRNGNYSTTIDIKGKGELAELSNAFNKMSSDIKTNIENIKSMTAQLNLLYTIVNRLSKTIDLNELKVIIIDLITDVMKANTTLLITEIDDDIFDIMVKNQNEDRHLDFQYNLGTEKTPPHDGLTVDMLMNMKNKGSMDVFISEEKHIVYLPLGARKEKQGLLVLIKPDEGFKESERELINALRNHISVAFDNAYLYTMAITDELTSLYTLRHFHTRIEEEINKFKRYGQKFSLLMLDIDNFKKINDTYGHPAGDIVLKKTASVIMASIRNIDLAFRYGGEEFTIILPESSINAASTVAERIRKGVAENVITVQDGLYLSVTVSIGVSSCPKNGITIRDIVTSADDFLYKAKNAGKNKVCMEEV